MPTQNCLWNFEREALRHLDTAYNLARWLTRIEEDAQDVVHRSDSSKLLRQALETLPRDSREVLILRELEEMSCKEVSDVTGMPLGSRARSRLRQSLANLVNADTPPRSL